jgi:hypothetical protein
LSKIQQNKDIIDLPNGQMFVDGHGTLPTEKRVFYGPKELDGHF